MTGAGQTIGRYEIEGEIGRGCMGIVYRAYDPLLQRVIALKTILAPHGMAETALKAFEERFFEEARAAARLTHHAIVIVHDLGRDEASGILFLALEYLQGQTLAQLIAGNRALDWREALRIAEPLAEGIHHASLLGVVHQDIKPANVMVLPTGQPKIMDFGIAKIETARLKLAGSGESFGTPLYMSPEQALGKEVDHRCDVFSLGAVIYRLVTGRDAFAAENVPHIFHRIIYEEPEPPSQVNPELPADIDLVIGRALAKNLETRYPDAKALADDIRDVLNERGPRHRNEVRLPLAGSRVVADDVEIVEDPRADPLAEIATLVSEASGPASDQDSSIKVASWPSDTARTVPPPPSSATAAGRPSDARGAAGVTRQLFDRLGTRVLVAVAALLAIVVLIALWRSSVRPPPKAEPSPSVTSAAPSIVPLPTSPQRPDVKTEPAATTANEGSGPSAGLLIDFEHHLKAGVVRVWVDGALVMDETFSSQSSKKIVAITLNKGYVARRLSIPPGGHALRVQVRWDDNVRTESIAGTFVGGKTCTLELRLNRLTKALSLNWS